MASQWGTSGSNSPWANSYWGGSGGGNWGGTGSPAPWAKTTPSSGAGAPTGEFDFGQMDPSSFDYEKWLGSFYSDVGETLPTEFSFNVGQGSTTPGTTAESLGYHWDALNQTWQREQGNQTFSRNQQEMDELLASKNRGMPGTAMGEAMSLYEADVNRMLEAEQGNFMRDLQMRMSGIESSFRGAADIREQGQSSADLLRERAESLGGLADDVVDKISGWVDTQMGEVERLGSMAIETAQSAESEWTTQLGKYKDVSAQKMSATAIGIQRSSAPIMSAIATGMHPDGTPMSKQEQQASYLALNYQTSVQVQHALAPLAFERERTLLEGSQYAAQLTQATAGVQQQQAGIQAQAGAQFGTLMLGAEQQAAAYRGLSEQLNMQGENAIAAATLQAAQMETAGLFQAAQLTRDFNPVSFLSGFLGLLSVPPEVWMRNFGSDMEFSFA